MYETLERTLQARRDLPSPATRRTIRERAGVSRSEVAREVGVTAQAVGLWESGQRCPRPKHLQAYVGVLQLLQREEVRDRER